MSAGQLRDRWLDLAVAHYHASAGTRAVLGDLLLDEMEILTERADVEFLFGCLDQLVAPRRRRAHAEVVN